MKRLNSSIRELWWKYAPLFHFAYHFVARYPYRTDLPLQSSQTNSQRMVCLPSQTYDRRRAYDRLKRVFDVCGCLCLLPAALPMMVGCGLAVWIEDRGPILFRQQRTGKYGRRFAMYKFRTMKTNAEALKRKYAHLNQLEWPDFKIPKDPRVTRVGRILRKTSLDELPQLVNVLLGEMSLVGPRPTSFDVDTYSLHHTERLEVMPGVTGLWQINGRSNLEFDERLKLDLEYIEKRSLWLDVSILLGTVKAVLRPRGAY